jgi:hypothetical protein
MEQLDRVAGRVLDDDLPAADPVDDLRAEGDTGRTQRGGDGVDVLHLEREAVPPGRIWPPPGPRFGALSSSRRSPRSSIAKGGAGCITSVKPRCPV